LQYNEYQNNVKLLNNIIDELNNVKDETANYQLTKPLIEQKDTLYHRMKDLKYLYGKII
jgi:hypothetical protein